MKKTFLIASLSLLFMLTACNNADENTESTTSNVEESVETNNEFEETQLDSDLTTNELIERVIETYGDTTSYRTEQSIQISQNDSNNAINITTELDENNQAHLTVRIGDRTNEYYIVDGEGYIIENEGSEVSNFSGERLVQENAFSDILNQLTNYSEGDISIEENMYIVQYSINDESDVEPFLPEEILNELSAIENISGDISLKFTSEYLLDSSELDLNIEDVTIFSNVLYSNAGEIESIDIPEAISK